MTVFRFGLKAMTKIGDEAAEGKVAGVWIVKIAVAKTVVELKVI